IGDMSLLAKVVPYHYKTGDLTLNTQIFGGLKVPTGSAERLKEELNESHEMSEKHKTAEDGIETVQSAIHGHDLALGSGSWDFPVGANLLLQYDRAFVLASLQYTLRTEGSHLYHYSDDVTYSVSPAYYTLLNHNYTVALGADLSGEYKGKDV